MARSNRRSSRRHRPTAYPKPLFKGPVGTALSILVLLLAGASQFRGTYLLNNGNGGTDWQIGEPQAGLIESLGNRSLSELRSHALEVANRDRQVNGLQPLVEDPLLSLAAQRHAEDMLKRQFFDHVNPDGQDPSDRFRAAGGPTGAGENIYMQSGKPTALSYGLVEQFQKGWMYSDGHRANLLKADYKTFGYGIVTDPFKGEVYAVQMFSFPVQ